MATSNGTTPPAGKHRAEGRDLGEGLPEGFPAVVAFDDSTRCGLYEQWLPASVPLTRPPSVGAGADTVDETTAVALVRHELPDDKRRRIRSVLETYGPKIRTVLTTSQRSPVADDVIEPDECLSAPIDREGFRDVVSRQLHLSTYAALLKRYYECTAFVASLEVQLDDEELAEDERYADMDEHVTRLKAQLDTVEEYLDPEGVRTLLYEIVPPEFERRDSERPANESKYRPDHCHRCGRDWNVNPDGSPAGFKRLGSFVWRCANCGKTYDRSNPTNNQIDPPR